MTILHAVPWDHVLALVLFCVSTALTPGPNNFMIMNSALQHGVLKSMPHYVGICAGFGVMVFMVALSLGQLMQYVLVLKPLLAVLGSAYLVYLAWGLWHSHGHVTQTAMVKPWRLFHALAFQWVNPKAWIMALSVMTLFALTSNVMWNAVFLSVIFFMVCLPCIGVWLVGGHLLQRYLQSEQRKQLFNKILALGLLLSIVLMLSLIHI